MNRLQPQPIETLIVHYRVNDGRFFGLSEGRPFTRPARRWQAVRVAIGQSNEDSKRGDRSALPGATWTAGQKLTMVCGCSLKAKPAGLPERRKKGDGSH